MAIKKTVTKAKKTTGQAPRMKKARVSKKVVQSVKGMHDILPEEAYLWKFFDETAKKVVEVYGYQKLEIPVVEKTELFVRGIGAGTDVVEKEMYTFTDKGGDSLTLRPEFTAGIARSYIENGMINLSQPVKVWLAGPVFRREKPQAGRYRQFHQFDIEAIGSLLPVVDVEVIFVGWKILKSLGFSELEVKINSIGCQECRPNYREELVGYLSSKRRRLCEDCRKRLRKNPLRVLDCKKAGCQAVAAEAPQTVDYLCEECHEHFKSVLEYLDQIGVPYNLDPKLVRGLDYYTKTTFEYFGTGKDEEIGALGGGGRYDELISMLGGRERPAVGFALGLERIIGLLKENQMIKKTKPPTDVFLIQLGELAKKKSLAMFDELVSGGIKVRAAFHKDSIKGQLKMADKAGAKLSLILGQKEAMEDTILIRDMDSGIQEIAGIKNLVPEIKNRLKKQ